MVDHHRAALDLGDGLGPGNTFLARELAGAALGPERNGDDRRKPPTISCPISRASSCARAIASRRSVMSMTSARLDRQRYLER